MQLTTYHDEATGQRIERPADLPDFDARPLPYPLPSGERLSLIAAQTTNQNRILAGAHRARAVEAMNQAYAQADILVEIELLRRACVRFVVALRLDNRQPDTCPEFGEGLRRMQAAQRAQIRDPQEERHELRRALTHFQSTPQPQYLAN